MEIKKIVFFALLMLGFFNVSAQERWNLELSAGPSLTYTYFRSDPGHPNLSRVNRFRPVGGLAVFYSLSPNFEIGSEIGFISSSLGYKISNIVVPSGRISTKERIIKVSSPVFGAGPRWSHRKNNIGYYFHPSIGLIFNPDFNSKYDAHLDVNQQINSNNLTYRHLNSVGFFSRIDVGFQFFTKNNNYFILGFRHLQGFNNFEEIASDNFLLLGEEFSLTNRNKGTNSSINLGYGIALSNLSFKRKRKEKKEDRASSIIEDIALSNGEYIRFSSGFRIRENPQRNRDNFYSNLTGQFSLA